MTQMLELAKKEFKIAIIDMFENFKHEYNWCIDEEIQQETENIKFLMKFLELKVQYMK